MAKKQPKLILPAPDALRSAAGGNQTDFWGKVGVTQSGGSRYENGNRHPPKVVRMLLALANGYASLEQLRSGELARRI